MFSVISKRVAMIFSTVAGRDVIGNKKGEKWINLQN